MPLVPRRLVAGGEGELTILVECLPDVESPPNVETESDQPNMLPRVVATFETHMTRLVKTNLDPSAGPLRVTSIGWLHHEENQVIVSFLFHGIQ